MSPAIFSAAFTAAGVRASYDLFPVPPGSLKREVLRIVASGIKGFNVTLPHKISVIPMMDRMDDSAVLTGAVNAVLVSPDGLAGYNTDMGGFGDSFDYLGVPDITGALVLVLGAGGAARAIVASLCQKGTSKIVIANRFIEETMELLSAVAPAFPGVIFEAIGLEGEELSRLSAGAALCVQTTSLGLRSDDPLPMDPARLPEGCFVYDIVYGTDVTPFVRTALDHGHRASDGKEMLLRQAARNYLLWLGKEAPVDAMREGMEQEMRKRGKVKA
jgi:shikimate dehydrogenase